MTARHYDVVIIGSGAAGASLAIRLAGHCKVALLSKGALLSGSTYWAQGGIAAAIANDDQPCLHAADTLTAGAHLNDTATVAAVTKQAPAMIQWLIDQGVHFHRAQDGTLHLGQEGGHSKRRIIHAADATGKAIASTLINNIQSLAIDCYEHTTAIDLIEQQHQCSGLYALNHHTGGVDTFSAKIVVLATGGASQVYGISSNPDCSSGDGISMAYRAGCQISHMEFNQFHPTCLYHPQAKAFLISEALRGEGAVLRNMDGVAFMQSYHPKGELAPRDIVARAIDAEIKRDGRPHVWLDISHMPADFIQSHFPTIYQRCLTHHIDITKQAIPVVPAAHYSCGGISTDSQGRSTLKHLYAIGEVAYTGLHGANRLASNSLLECLVFAAQASNSIQNTLNNHHPTTNSTPPAWDASRATPSTESIIVRHHWLAIQQLMWHYVGIVRSHQRLKHALEQVRIHQREIQAYYEKSIVSRDLIELRNLAQTAELIIMAAQRRKQNIGLHFNADNQHHNSTQTQAKHTS